MQELIEKLNKEKFASYIQPQQLQQQQVNVLATILTGKVNGGENREDNSGGNREDHREDSKEENTSSINNALMAEVLRRLAITEEAALLATTAAANATNVAIAVGSPSSATPDLLDASFARLQALEEAAKQVQLPLASWQRTLPPALVQSLLRSNSQLLPPPPHAPSAFLAAVPPPQLSHNYHTPSESNDTSDWSRLWFQNHEYIEALMNF
jgi:hypothetical protein